MRYALLSLVLVAGCSGPSERIVANTTEVRRLATSSGQRFERIAVQADYEQPSLPQIKAEAVEGKGEQERILDAVDMIYHALTGVEDQTPWWVAPIVYVALALAILGVCFLVWHTGLGRFVKGWLGLCTPTERRAAALTASLIDLKPEEAVEAVAELRRRDSTFDAAFRRAAPIRTNRRME